MAFTNPYQSASGKGSKNPFFPDDEVATSELPLWQRNELMERLGDATSTTTSGLLGLLSMPGSLAYDMALARPLGSGSTGGDVLDSIGLRPGKEMLGGWARPVADFTFEAVTDPLNFVSLGTGAASKATNAAKAAGIFGDLQRVAGRSLVDDVGRGARRLDDLGDMGYANNARQSFADNFNQGLGNLSDDDLMSRPLVGSRAAARDTTLQDLVRAQPNPTEAIRGVDNYLQKYGQTYADVADQTLGHDIGLNLPRFLGGEMATQLPGGRGVAVAMDRIGQGIRWSGPGRWAHSASNLFGDDVKGATREGDQILAKSLSRADTRGNLIADTGNTTLLRELRERAPQVFNDPRISTAFRNVVEGTASQAERAMVTGNNLDSFVTRWRNQADDYITRSREAGIGSGELQDNYELGYFPRAIDKDLFRRGSAPATGGRNYSVMTGDQLARDQAYSVPGGTDTLNRLSRDPRVQQAATDDDAANYITTELNSMVQRANQQRTAPGSPPPLPAYTRDNAVKLARDFRSLRPEAIEAGRGIFDSHFTEDWTRYTKGRERALQRARVIQDKLGNTAQMQHYMQVPGGGHNSMEGTLQQLDMRTNDLRNFIGPLQAGVGRADGAIQQITNRINARLAGTGQQIDVNDLANVSVDQRLVERFNRIADYYTMPEVQSRALELLDGVTRLWKSTILAWPAKHARDWMGALFSNLVEVGYSPSYTRGYAVAKYVQQGQWDRVEQYIRQMPRYSQRAATDMQGAINELRGDLAAHGLLRGRRIEDLGTQLTGRQTGAGVLSELVPGSTPATTVGYQIGDALTGRTPLPSSSAAYSELSGLGQTGRLMSGYADSIGRFGRAANPFDDSLRFIDYLNEETLRDPILRWSSKLGDITDSGNRMAGYFGLIFNGVSPQEATRRMMAAHVDYGNLTRFEKGFMRRIVPFWSFNSRIGRYVVGQIWDNPGGRFSQLGLRAPEIVGESFADESDPYTPKQIKENIGFSLESMRDLPGVGSLVNLIAPQKDGVNSYLNDVDLPGVGLINMLKVKRGIDGTPHLMNSVKHTVMDSVGGLAHPGIRMGAELLTGRNLHTGKSLTEFEPTTQKLGRKLGVQPFGTMDSLLNMSSYPLEFAPHASRVLQFANRLADSERVPDVSARVMQNLVNMLSGVKVTNISEDASRLDASRELGEMLSDSPALRTFEQKFIPKEMLEFADPEDLLLYRLDRQMRNEARKSRAKLSDSDVTNPFLR